MSAETEQANFVTMASYVVSEMVPYFRTNVVMLNSVAVKNFRERSAGAPGSTVLKFGTRGNVSVAVTNESAQVSKSEYTETSTTLTVQKASAYFELTMEAELFGNDMSDLDAIARDAGLACAQKFDVDTLALADSYTASVGSTNTDLTVNILKKAPYKVRLNKVTGPLVYALHTTQIENIQSNIITTGAAIWGNQNVNLDILSGQPSVNGRAGQIFNTDILETTNTKSINSGVDWAGFCYSPQWAVAAGVLGRFVPLMDVNSQYVLKGMSVSMFYQVAKWADGAACYIISKQ